MADKMVRVKFPEGAQSAAVGGETYQIRDGVATIPEDKLHHLGHRDDLVILDAAGEEQRTTQEHHELHHAVVKDEEPSLYKVAIPLRQLDPSRAAEDPDLIGLNLPMVVDDEDEAVDDEDEAEDDDMLAEDEPSPAGRRNAAKK